MADKAAPLSVVVEDDTETVRVDPLTGTVEVDQPDGGVVVQLDARRKAQDGSDEDTWFANLAEDMDQSKLGIIANDLYDSIGADDRSRGDYLTNLARGLELLGTKLQEPRSTPGDASSGDGMATVTNPLLLEAVLKGWANAQAELLPANGPVKIRDDGNADATRDDLAESLERDMNHWFTTTAAEYYPDTSHMLLWGTYLGGSGFKKVYRCPMRRRPVSESVRVQDLIVSDTTKDLRSCSRITHQIPMRPSIMKRMKLIGAYRDVALTQPTPTPNPVSAKVAGIQGTQPPTRPEDQPFTVWEAQCELDLDEFIPEKSKFKGEGIPLPFLVTLDKDSREILAIRRDWNEDDAECERKRMYVKYPYVPGPGFYGTGMLNILGNSSAAMTAAWREALDAGMYANFPGGVIAKLGARQNTSNFRPAPGEFIAIETNGMPIGQVVTGLPYKDVTPGLLTLMDKIIAQSQAVGGAAEIPVAEGLQNVPVGTMLAAIEQATKIMAAAHKGMHTAQAEEFQLIIALFRERPEDFWCANKVCPRDYWNEEKFLQAINACELVPQSDPNVPSHIHRVSKAIALLNLMAVPQFAGRLDPKEVLVRCLRAIREDERGLVIDPPPQSAQPSPTDIAKLLEANAKVAQAQNQGQKIHFDAVIANLREQAKMAEARSREKVSQNDLQRQVFTNTQDQQSQRREQDLQASELALDADVAAAEQAREDRRLDHEIAYDHADLAIKRTVANKPAPAKAKT